MPENISVVSTKLNEKVGSYHKEKYQLIIFMFCIVYSYLLITNYKILNQTKYKKNNINCFRTN